MHLVHGDVVAVLVAGIGFAADLGADVHLRRQADDADANAVFDAGFNRVVDVSWVGGEEGAEHDDDFPRAMGGRVVECCSRHFEGVLEGWVALGLGAAHALDRGDVVVWVAGHVAYADGHAVSHAEDSKLRDGILLKEFSDEGHRVGDG